METKSTTPARPKHRVEKNPPTVEALEARIAPSAAGSKKDPVPPPYAPGTLYGLVRRENLSR